MAVVANEFANLTDDLTAIMFGGISWNITFQDTEPQNKVGCLAPAFTTICHHIAQACVLAGAQSAMRCLLLQSAGCPWLDGNERSGSC
jgi:hypothetical protein